MALCFGYRTDQYYDCGSDLFDYAACAFLALRGTGARELSFLLWLFHDPVYRWCTVQLSHLKDVSKQAVEPF